MLSTNEVAQVFDTLLSVPGMNDVVKIDLKISRRNVLLLNHIIELGLSSGEDKNSSFLANAPEGTKAEIKALASDCLEKAGLVEFSQKLSLLSTDSKK